MIASEDLISPLARETLLIDFQGPYAEGLPGERLTGSPRQIRGYVSR